MQCKQMYDLLDRFWRWEPNKLPEKEKKHSGKDVERCVCVCAQKLNKKITRERNCFGYECNQKLVCAIKYIYLFTPHSLRLAYISIGLAHFHSSVLSLLVFCRPLEKVLRGAHREIYCSTGNIHQIENPNHTHKIYDYGTYKHLKKSHARIQKSSINAWCEKKTYIYSNLPIEKDNSRRSNT